MSDVRELFDMICEGLGIPTPDTILEARVYVNHKFPDLNSRQAFLGSMVDNMCREFGIDKNKLLDFWKEAG